MRLRVPADFLADARAAYVRANARAMAWMLDRPPLFGAFVNTKVNGRTLQDTTAADGWRGPEVVYGWIQGRALEALVAHAAFFEREDPALASRLDEAARRLYPALEALYARDGHAAFAYDAALRPVYPDGDAILRPQSAPGDLWTFSDVFVLKGLAAAAARYAPERLDGPVAGLGQVVEAIEDGRFISDERRPLDAAARAAVRGDYGPRMIMLGAAALLRAIGRADAAAFGPRFLAHTLERRMTASGALADVPGQPACNPGHAIELVGFALEGGEELDPGTMDALRRVLIGSFRVGFAPPGLRLSVSLESGRATTPWLPWWSLPEAVRAAAQLHERTRDDAALAVWRAAHQAFFAHYWREDPPVAYQTLTRDGPADYVPATPDLDPGYHTGLSFLAAIRAIDRMG